MISASHKGDEAPIGGPGPLNLVKLCVGVDSPADLDAWRARRAAAQAAEGLAPRVAHRTRQTPRRAEELLQGGSLYWVFKGRILARQRLLAIEPAEDGPGVDLVMAPELILTRPATRRPFQGWRYLSAAEAPEDAAGGLDAQHARAALPSALREAVAEYGVL